MSEKFEKLKADVARVLQRSPRMFAAASRLFYGVDRRFRTLSPDTPKAVDAAWIEAKRLQGKSLGDYYEFGVFRGYTLWHAEQSARRLGIRDSRFWGFDSFQGLPPVAGTDAEGGEFFEGQFACSREDVLKHLTTHGAEIDRITLIEGFFGDSLTPELKREHRFRPVGVALIDCDLYSSTKEVLDWLADLLQDNSILLFDDWKSFNEQEDRGQPLAFREFLQGRNWDPEHFEDFGRHGRSFIMQRTH
ncbi:MAG: TylF/MycF/NovP-related O-methyltransferase [Steroidobacteraceae bacterium]